LRIARALILRGNSGVSGSFRHFSPTFPRRRFATAPTHPAATDGAPPSIMTISLTDVYRIAHLARVEIDAAHAEEVRAKLNSIFGLIDQLAAVDTTGVVPMAHAQEATLPLRDDVVRETDLRERYQRLAPAVDDGLYLVPKVLE
jgi:aspartyl-tRNA(Asn)/glutamyl-tRNA(Gln) amidotransferase subunit C